MKASNAKKVRRITRVYQDCQLQAGVALLLDEAASHYVSRVMRMVVSDSLQLFDGKGNQADVEIVELSKKTVTVMCGEVTSPERESPIAIRLIQAISKGDRMDFTLQKAVELGVTEIRPVFSERSAVSLKGERVDKKLQHWQGVVVSACEQSWRNVVPVVEQPATLSNLDFANGTTLVLDPNAKQGLQAFANTHINLDLVTVVIGPEGGLSEQELAALSAQGVHGISLGPRVLRTETAGLAVIAALQTLYGDLG